MDSSSETRKKVTLNSIFVAVALVIVTQFVALLITNVNQPIIAQSGYSYAPAGTSSYGSLENALILVFFVFLTTVAALFLLRKKKMKFFRWMVFLGTSFALFLLTLLTADSLLSSFLDESTSSLFSFLVALVPVGLLATTLRPRLTFLGPSVTVLLSAEVGSYFASTIPLLTALLIPVAFSLYDIYAVFKGPLKQLISLAPESLGGMSTKVSEFTIGVGDTVFYSMLPALALFQFNLSAAIATLLAVDVGVIITLRALQSARLLPGLPIPMALGLTTLLISARIL